MKKWSLLVALLIAALFSLLPSGAQENSITIVVDNYEEMDDDTDAVVQITHETFAVFNMESGGFIYSDWCFETAKYDDEPLILPMGLDWETAPENSEAGFNYRATFNGGDAEWVYVRTCQGEEPQSTEESEENLPEPEILSPVEDEEIAWAWSDGFDADAVNCQPNNPQSCESFTVLHPFGIDRDVLEDFLAEQGVSVPIFGTFDTLIGHDYLSALGGLQNNMPDGNALYVIGS